MPQSKFSNKLKQKRKFWAAHIAAWRKSGLSQVEYCRQQGLIPYQLSYWVNRKSRRSTSSLPNLVEVALPPAEIETAAAASGLQLITKHGERLDIGNNFSAESLAKVVQVLRRLS